jgi:hypothetical protein
MIAVGWAVASPHIQRLACWKKFFDTRPDQTARRNDKFYGSNDAVCGKEVPFEGYVDIAGHF